MGSRAIATIALGLALLLTAGYFTPESISTYFSNLNIDYEPAVKLIQPYAAYLDPYSEYFKPYLKYLEQYTQYFTKVSTAKDGELLLSHEELRKYDSSSGSSQLYLAILGEVFDVAKGAQHYGPGGGYSSFTGRDATRAYVTGDFTEAGLIDDVSDLEVASLEGIADWLSFYKEEYKYMGKVIGRYYDKNGNPTKELLSIKEKINSAKRNKWVEQNNKDVFPPCNSEWSKEMGSRVWCTEKSGGVDRQWVGVPRLLQISGKDPRCVCVRNFGPPSSDPSTTTHKNIGDLDDPNLKEYPGCPSGSETCSVSHP